MLTLVLTFFLILFWRLQNRVKPSCLSQQNESTPVRLSPARWDMGGTPSKTLEEIEEDGSTDSQSGDVPNSSEHFRERTLEEEEPQVIAEQAPETIIDLEQEASPQQYFDAIEDQPISDIDVGGDVADADMSEDMEPEREYPTEQEILRALKKKAKWIAEDICYKWQNKRENTKKSKLKSTRAKAQQSREERGTGKVGQLHSSTMI